VLRDTYTIQSGYQVAVQDDCDDFEQFAQDISFEDYYQQLHQFEREQPNVKLLQQFRSFLQSPLDLDDAVAIACGGFF
jgi:hypothetical protein